MCEVARARYLGAVAEKAVEKARCSVQVAVAALLKDQSSAQEVVAALWTQGLVEEVGKRAA